MDIEERLRASLVAPDPGPGFSARVMARVRRGDSRRGGRFIVVGSVLAMAAAAGMLVWQFSSSGQPQAERMTLPVMSDPVRLEEQRTATTEPQQVQPEFPAPAAAAAPTAPAAFTVILLSPRQEVQDADLHHRVEDFHAALGDELRKVPGLTLRVSSSISLEAGDAADFVVSLSSAGPMPMSGEAIRPADDGNAYTPSGRTAGAVVGNVGSNSGNASSGAASKGADAMNGVVSVILATRMAGLDVTNTLNEFTGGGGLRLAFTDERGAIAGVSGDGSIINQTAPLLGNSRKACWVEIRVSQRTAVASRYKFQVHEDDSPAQLAKALLEKLLLQVLPRDAGYQQRVLARLGNGEMDGSLLPDLLPLLVAGGGDRLEPPTLQAFFRFVANQPAGTRAKVWKTLNRADSPLLVAPMLDSLRQDPDHEVRLAALANLEAHHAGIPAVRGAFEALEQREADPFMRAALRWTLHGENQWRADVMSAVQDAGLPYDARLAPLIARTTADANSFQMSQKRRSLVEQERVLQPLLSLVSENVHDPDGEWVTSQALRLLSSVEHPAVGELFLSLLRETSLPTEVNGTVRRWAVDHWADPRVPQALGR